MRQGSSSPLRTLNANRVPRRSTMNSTRGPRGPRDQARNRLWPPAPNSLFLWSCLIYRLLASPGPAICLAVRSTIRLHLPHFRHTQAPVLPRPHLPNNKDNSPRASGLCAALISITTHQPITRCSTRTPPCSLEKSQAGRQSRSHRPTRPTLSCADVSH